MILKGKRVLVTGAEGFIGSHLVERLVEEGASVKALVLYNSFSHWGWLEKSPAAREVRIETGDIRDAHYCLKLLQGTEVVFHLAALIPIPYSFRAPDSYIDTNVKGTLNICMAAMEAGVERLVQTSTSEVYGTARQVPIDETHPLHPQSPYAASKVGADAVAASFYASFGLPVVIARPFNTYGPRQSARAVIPAVMTQIAAGKNPIMLGDPTPTRDFTFVSDTVEGLLAVAGLKDAGGEVFNIGSNSEISIGQLVEKIQQVMGCRITVQADQERLRPRHSEVFRLRCDNRRLKQKSGFEPTVGLEEGLSRTAEWIQRNLDSYKEELYHV